MHIKVKLFATLREGRFTEGEREYPAGTTIGHIIQALEMDEKEAALIFVNGLHAKAGDELHDGDTLAIFPPIGGG
ncbi:MAG TPA: MoaD/ThiS family protein [Syntrophorhabdaceae bacterium]|jgi:molybdopterin converting factor small subunit|nr:MoaD/ThiS family protein [Syntrophorhabdaceae bacterium]HNT69947.1 MoaD/ThiS family protein [Syntrophorhabdaceae bacterium]